MKKLSLALILLAAAATAYAQCYPRNPKPTRVIITPDGKKITVNGGTVGYKDFTGKMASLEDDIESVERKLSKADPATKKGMALEHERNTLALEFIHEAHKYIIDGGLKRKDSRTRKIVLFMNNEAAMLKKQLKEYPNFPYLDYLDDPILMLRDIRRGKIKDHDRLPSRDSALLKEIHEMQRKALEEIHKKQMKSRKK